MYKTIYTFKEILLSSLAIMGVYMVLTGGTEKDLDQEDYVQGFKKIIVVIILFFSITIGYSLGAVLVKDLRGINPL